MSDVALEVSGLSVTLPLRQDAIRVVDRLGLQLQAGEMVGLAGESGCGKTMVALALMGLLEGSGARVRADSVALGGTSLPEPAKGFVTERGRRVAMVFQEPTTALDPVFSIGWQIKRVVQRRFGLKQNAARQRALDALAGVGFTDTTAIYRAYPHQLSGGMRQLAMIAMASAVEPELLIADEPTTALDVTTQRHAMQCLQTLCRRKRTAVLLISHDLGLIAEYCSRILVMYCGRIVESAAYDAFYAHPKHPYSDGLLRTVPRLSASGAPQALEGTIAPPGRLPPGCHFAPRCSRASDRCRDTVPSLTAEGDRHYACHHPL